MTDGYQFESLGDLKRWLDNIHSIDLDTVLPETSDHITLHWIEETLSDGSTVYNVRLNT